MQGSIIEVDSGENNDSYNLDYARMDLIVSEIIQWWICFNLTQWYFDLNSYYSGHEHSGHGL